MVLNGDGIGESRHGGFATRARVRPDALVHLPSALSTRRAAAIGTAGFTAMLAVLRLEDAGLAPGDGDVLVTGASGGAGSIAVALLAGRGHRVIASTGRGQEHGEYLRSLGAAEILDRRELSEEPGRPLQSQRFTAAIDGVGSTTLANVLAQTAWGGTVAAYGLARAPTCPPPCRPPSCAAASRGSLGRVPTPLRERAWAALAAELGPALLDSMTTSVGLAEPCRRGAYWPGGPRPHRRRGGTMSGGPDHRPPGTRRGPCARSPSSPGRAAARRAAELFPARRGARRRGRRVNRADLAQAAGQYPPPPGASELPGLEVSGRRRDTGEEVVALLAGGGYAEVVAVPEGQLLPAPEGIGLIDAAGVVEATATVVSNLVLEAGLREGETVLVHGGTGGIGTVAIQLATHMDARVLTTVGSDDALPIVAQLGAAEAWNRRIIDLPAAVREAGGADVILDIVGGSALPDNVSMLNEGGRLVIIRTLGGAEGELPIGRADGQARPRDRVDAALPPGGEQGRDPRGDPLPGLAAAGLRQPADPDPRSPPARGGRPGARDPARRRAPRQGDPGGRGTGRRAPPREASPQRMSVLGAPMIGVMCLCFAAIVLPAVGKHLAFVAVPIGVLCFIPLIICRLSFIPIPDAVYPKWARPIRHADEQSVKDADAWLRAHRQRHP